MSFEHTAPLGRTPECRDADDLHAFMTAQVIAYARQLAPQPRHTTRLLAAQIGWREARLAQALATLQTQRRVTLNPHDQTWCAL